ncbi:MAG: Panacea domain-containing protein [bacterium]
MSKNNKPKTLREYNTLTFEDPQCGGEKKLRELILYIADQCFEDRYFGATKLNKILYFADFESFRRYGKPITGVQYQRLPEGPAPVRLLPIRQQMERDGDVVLKEVITIGGIQKRLIALRKPNLNMFSAQEIDIVYQVIRELWNKTAKQTSKLTHGLSWRIYNDYDLMPYESILLDDEITQDDVERAKELADKHGWNE